MYWWEDQPNENLYMEITGRDDIGSDLLAPLSARGGKPTGAYALVPTVKPGDVVIHYHTPAETIGGVSVVSGSPEPSTLFWAPRGTYARQADEQPHWMPGLRVPITGWTDVVPPVTLSDIRAEQTAILDLREQLEAQYPGAPLYFPWIPYGDGPIRTFQSYLVKMPRSAMGLLPALMTAVEKVQTAAPTSYSDEGASERELLTLVGKSRTTGQGFMKDQTAKMAIEAHAMDLAIDYWSQRGEVEDVHGNQSYDLTCITNGTEVHIEVKGTTTDGSHLFLTRNEVVHAKSWPEVCLFVVANIKVTRSTDGAIDASGGVVHIEHPWFIDDEKLTPLVFRYEL